MTFWRNKQVWAFGLAGLLLTAALPTSALADGGADQQVGQMQSQLNDLKSQQNATLDQIHQLEAQINDAMSQSTQLQQQIAATKKSLEAQKVKLQQRVVAMYEGGDVSFWNVLFDATNFSDFLDRFDMLTLIVSQDKSMVDQYTAAMQKLQQEQADLNAQQQQRKAKQQQLIALEQQQQAQYQTLQDQLDAANAQIAGEQGGEAASYQALSGVWQNVPTTAPDIGSGTYVWPVPSSHQITSGYGPRSGEFHKGIDIGCPIGTPIVAVGDGTVIMAGPAEGFGHWVVIEHSNGLLSVYGHMYADGIKVAVGQHVAQGQVIATSGEDGEATGPHLHFAFATGISGGRMLYVNPMGYLQ